MADNSAQEKTEEATPKRREDSKKKGQVPRSKELSTFTSLITAGVGMLMFGESIIADINALIVKSLSFTPEAAFSKVIIGEQVSHAAISFLTLLIPFFILVVLATIATPLLMGGWVFSADQFTPKFERISPAKGFARIFSVKSIMELLKAVGKFVLVAAAAILVISSAMEEIFTLPLQPLGEAFANTGMLFIWCFFGFSSVMIVIVLIDVPFQIFQFSKQLKMSKQEIKDEMKETDGRPEVKGAIRERQQEFARQRMMAEVPTADVIITNPTHYSVALKYDQSGSGGPRLIAKGQDLVAARIRELGSEHNIPLFSAPPLARALYASTDINQEIPGNLFMAVAQVLAYIYQLQTAQAAHRSKPKKPTILPIPDEYAHHRINRRTE